MALLLPHQLHTGRVYFSLLSLPSGIEYSNVSSINKWLQVSDRIVNARFVEVDYDMVRPCDHDLPNEPLLQVQVIISGYYAHK